MPELEVVKAFNNPQLLLQEWPSLDFDLLISDIEMPGFNGLQVAGMLKGKAIIFTTAYKEFAVEAFDHDAVDYVIKPVKPERLKQAVQKAAGLLQKKHNKPRQLQLNTNRGKALINTDRIACIVTSDIDSRDKDILFNDGLSIMAKNCSFEKLLESLATDEFCRINKRTVIAVKHVQYYTHDTVTTDILLPDGTFRTFLLSEIYRGDFLKAVRA